MTSIWTSEDMRLLISVWTPRGWPECHKLHRPECRKLLRSEHRKIGLNATSCIQASVPIFWSKWHSGQFSDVQIEVISSIQTDERHSGHGYFCVTIYFGIQVNILFRYSDWLSPYQTDSSFKTTSLPILTGIVTSLHFSANFRAFIVFNPLIPRKHESRCYLLSRSPVDWIGAAVIPQNLPFIFSGSIHFTPQSSILRSSKSSAT